MGIRRLTFFTVGVGGALAFFPVVGLEAKTGFLTGVLGFEAVFTADFGEASTGAGASCSGSATGGASATWSVRVTISPFSDCAASSSP